MGVVQINKVMKTETPLEKAIAKFEELKDKSTSLKDSVYLDGVLSVLESIKPYEVEYSSLKDKRITELEERCDNLESLLDTNGIFFANL